MGLQKASSFLYQAPGPSRQETEREGGACPDQSSRSSRFCLLEGETVLWCPRRVHVATHCLCSGQAGARRGFGEISCSGRPAFWVFEIQWTLILEGNIPWYL